MKLKNRTILESTDVVEMYNEVVDRISESVTTFQQRGSGWQLVAVDRLEIKVISYNPLKGKSYIPLSRELLSTKSIINMKNDDNQCFKWAIARALYPIHDTHGHLENVTKMFKAQAEDLDWSDTAFPVTLSGIPKFERRNSISVNVYAYNRDEQVHVLKAIDDEQPDHVNLLLISYGRDHITVS